MMPGERRKPKSGLRDPITWLLFAILLILGFTTIGLLIAILVKV
jgi:hypothetical protein